jgi:hypothetical protein
VRLLAKPQTPTQEFRVQFSISKQPRTVEFGTFEIDDFPASAGKKS